MTNRFESLVDYGTSAIAGGASGYCCALLVASPIAPVAAGSAGFLGVLTLMKRIGASDNRKHMVKLAPLPLPEFDEAEELLLEDGADEDELILEIEAPMAVSEAQARIASAFDALGPSQEEAPLELSDPLPEDQGSNRVVALFGGEYEQGADPAQVKARIDEHLAARDAQRSPASGVELVPDASEALAAALKGLGRDKS